MGYEIPFTIADVAALLSIRRLRGGNEDAFGVECPFCGDTRGKCNLCVQKDGEVKNVYHCYHCGAAGNMLTLYADLTGMCGYDRYRRAYHEIKERLSLGHASGGMRIEKHTYRKKPARPDDQPASVKPGYLDQVYQEMLSMLELRTEHREDLLRRGLSQEEAMRMEADGYRSTDAGKSQQIARALLGKGYSLKGVPGFYRNYQGDWEAAFYPSNRGYLCPVKSVDGKIKGFQIRLDHPYKKRKYLWFTSSGMDGGTSSKSPAGLSGSIRDNTVRVTEGILKAEIAAQKTGLAYIGIPGVSNYKGLYQVLEQLKGQGLELVYECYDMEKMMPLECGRDYDASCWSCPWNHFAVSRSECPKKRQKRDCIRKGCLKLYEICRELDLKCSRVVWDTNADGMWNGVYKGIDDWIMWEEQKRTHFGTQAV